MSGQHVVVVGHGMAGARIASELRGHGGRGADVKVTVLGAEPEQAYNRILLSQVLAGKVTESDVTLVETAERGVDVRSGHQVSTIDRSAQTVTVQGPAGTEVVGYDHLVLATGSRPVIPSLPGLAESPAGPTAGAAPHAGRQPELDQVAGLPDQVAGLPERVAVFRTLADCRRILSATHGTGSAIVLGGGLLGLEAARGLVGRGLAVSVVHPVGRLMNRQLDPGASAVLVDTLTRLGITTHLDSPATGVEIGTDEVRLTLADGSRITAGLLVLACGVRPETALAARAGLAVRHGVLVNDQLRTTDERIWAIGDCAEVSSGGAGVSGLVAPAWEQARVLARVLAGDHAARYHPLPTVTRLKADGIDLAAMGSLEDGPEQLTFTDPTRGTYARLAIDGDRLVGAVMLGDNPTVGTLVQLFDRGAPVPSDRRGLLLGRLTGTPTVATAAESPVLMPDSATVCHCNSVSKGTLVRCWRAGAHTVPDMVAASRATTGCGTCRGAVEGIVDWLNRTDAVDRAGSENQAETADRTDTAEVTS